MVNLQRCKFLSVAIALLVVGTDTLKGVATQSKPAGAGFVNLAPDLNLRANPNLIASSQGPFAFWKRRPRTRLGVRSGVCMVSPGLIDKYTTWHDRPLFVWQGNGSQVNIRNRENKTVFWTQKINGTEQQVAYNGKDSLPPGLYQWQVLGTNSSVPNSWTTFEVMSTTERDTIKSELLSLEQQLQAKGASKEEIALKKAEYFGDRELWSDAVQTLYQVENPSASFVEQRRSYVASLCTTQSATK